MSRYDSIGSVGYVGGSTATALQITVPHLRAQGFDVQDFMHKMIASLEGMGLKPQSDMQVEHVEMSAAPMAISAQNSGQGAFLG